MEPTLNDRAKEQIRRSYDAIDRANKESTRIEETLRKSKDVRARAIPVLKKAGLIK